jgi:hypothetical protein
MSSGFNNLLAGLGGKDLVLPYFQAGMLADSWPMSYQVKIDSSPYYGKGDGYFHPSTHALMGERELYYRFHPETKDKVLIEPPTIERQMAFAMGSALHGVLQAQMDMMKLVRGSQDIEVEYVREEHNLRGRLDWVCHLPNGQIVPVEMKTRTVSKFAWQAEPEPSWIAQLTLAMDALDFDLGVLLMVEAGYPYRMTEFHIQRDTLLLSQIYGRFARVRQALADNEPPNYCCPPDSAIMKKCDARYQCWLAK